jgi:hypothetical protein
MPFTDSSAWNYIADLLESDTPFCQVILRQPKGEVAYETLITPSPNSPKIYIKIQKRSGRIVGRSFHYDLKG